MWPHSWKTIASRLVFKNPWWEYWIKEFETPSGYHGEYHFIHTNGGVVIIPVTDAGEILLIRQYRYINDNVFLEFPAGGIREGESCIDAAHRELREETGYDARELFEVGKFIPFLGVTDEICWVFLGKALFYAPMKGDYQEQIEVVRLSVQEAKATIGQICSDGKSLAAWVLAMPYLC